MPNQIQAELAAVSQHTVAFELEPTFNALYSLMLVNYSDDLSGLDEWVYRTRTSLSPERYHNNRLVLEGLHYAAVPIRSWKTFEDYLKDLSETSPIVLRDRLLERIAYGKSCDLPRGVRPEHIIEPERLLDKETYINFLLEKFSGPDTDVELERETHDYLTDPARMHALMVYHLQTMWRDVVRAEWKRVQPMLEDAVNAFRAQDILGGYAGRQNILDLVRRVSRQDVPHYLESIIARSRQVVLVPSAHVGPYRAKFVADDTVWIIFSAHMPDGVRVESPALARAELLMQLSALTDDTRLKILELLALHGDLCAQDVITLLDLSQPAASRHLKQLSATGYVIERWRDGNKCYSLNRERLDMTFQLMDHYLSKQREDSLSLKRE
jgi:ArsR family transcriptional regulator